MAIFFRSVVVISGKGILPARMMNACAAKAAPRYRPEELVPSAYKGRGDKKENVPCALLDLS
jgi:hypothetical protein